MRMRRDGRAYAQAQCGTGGVCLLVSSDGLRTVAQQTLRFALSADLARTLCRQVRLVAVWPPDHMDSAETGAACLAGE